MRQIRNIRKRAVETAGRGLGVERAFAFYRPEAFGECELLLLRDVLIGENQHRILPERVGDGRKIGIGHGLGQIGFVNFRSKIGGDGVNGDAHSQYSQ